MKKRIIACILCLSCLLSLTFVFAHAQETKDSEWRESVVLSEAIDEYIFEQTKEAASFFVNDGFSQSTFLTENTEKEIVDLIPLYNVRDEIEAYCHVFSPVGYAIVNINDGKVVEFSESDIFPILETDARIYYNGPLQYYTKETQNYKHIVTDEIYSDMQLQDRHSKVEIEYGVRGIQPKIVEMKELTHSLSTITSGGGNGYCPLTGVTIFMYYYVNYLGATFPNGITSAQGILNYLRNTYMTDQPIWLADAYYSHTDSNGNNCLGLWNFVQTKSNFDVYVGGISWNNILNNIDNDRPVVLEINTSAVQEGGTGTHIVVAYGYRTGGADSTNYLKVNTGWSSPKNVSLYYNDLDMSYDLLYGVGPF